WQEITRGWKGSACWTPRRTAAEPVQNRRAYGNAASSAGTMVLPIGQSASPARFRCAQANGIPMMVTARRMAVTAWPSASSVYEAMLNAARAHGKPMMVIAITIPAITQPKAIHRPPKTIHNRFSTRDRADMGLPEEVVAP